MAHGQPAGLQHPRPARRQAGGRNGRGITTSTATGPAAKSSGNAKSAKSNKQPKAPKVVAPPAEDDEDATAAMPETGVFLAREDIEELFAIIRQGTKVRVVK